LKESLLMARSSVW